MAGLFYLVTLQLLQDSIVHDRILILLSASYYFVWCYSIYCVQRTNLFQTRASTLLYCFIEIRYHDQSSNNQKCHVRRILTNYLR